MRWKREQSEFSSYAKTWGTVRTFWRTLISRTYSSYNQKKPTPNFIGTLSSIFPSVYPVFPQLPFFTRVWPWAGDGGRAGCEVLAGGTQGKNTDFSKTPHSRSDSHASIFPEQTWMNSTTRLRIGHERTFCLMSVKKTILFHWMSRWKFLMWCIFGKFTSIRSVSWASPAWSFTVSPQCHCDQRQNLTWTEPGQKFNYHFNAAFN